jgi:PAS domain S-box-containing protein
MSGRSLKIIGAVSCLLAAWGILFTGVILAVDRIRNMPEWVTLAVLIAAGGLVFVSGRSARTRWGLMLAAVSTGAALACVWLAGRDLSPVEAKWRRDESKRLAETLLAVGKQVAKLESISSSVGDQIGRYLRTSVGEEGLGGVDRYQTFAVLDSLARGISQSGALPPGTEIGIEVFDAKMDRYAWAGWPQSIGRLERGYIDSGVELVYSREVSLYRILTHLVPVHDGGGNRIATVLIDLPLEVNFRVNNRFLKSASLADNIPTGQVARVTFEYFPSLTNLPVRLDHFRRIQRQNYEHRQRMIQWRLAREKGGRIEGGDSASAAVTQVMATRRPASEDSVLLFFPFPEYIEPTSEIGGDEVMGLHGRVLLRSARGNPLLSATAQGFPFQRFAEQRESRYLSFARAFVALSLLILFVVAMLGLERVGRWAWWRCALLVSFLVLLRYTLLSFQTYSIGGAYKIFDPTVFATPILGGIMRNSGDLLLTGVFLVIAVYGVMKLARRRETEKPRVTIPPRPARWHFVAKGTATAAVLYGVIWLARGFTNAVVVNANPRLIGETMQVTDSSVIVLHLGTYLTLTGILLAGMSVVWAIFRFTTWTDARRSALVAFLLLIAAAMPSGQWETVPMFAFALLFIVLAPRFVQREDAVSVVIVSFFLVIVTSAVTYLFFGREYDNLRKGFVREKVAELLTPSDNWKVVILEDLLEEYGKRPEITRTLRDPAGRDVQRLAFDLWASGPLSLLGYSSSIYVLTERDSVASAFSVDMPYRIRIPGGGERLDTPAENAWAVLDLTRNTPQGIVRYYRGILNVEDSAGPAGARGAGRTIGKVVVDLPFIFESLEWAAQTGPRTPEVLRNVQAGGVAPRVEEPEALLLARLDGRRTFESSSESLPVGAIVPGDQFARGLEDRWPLLKTERGWYRILIQRTEESDRYLLAGFAVPSPARHLIRWSTVFSLYLFFTVAILVAIALLGTIPYIKELLPTLTPGRKLGFQQKLLASFLVVAVVPAVLLGTFAVQFIKARFLEEARQEALQKAYGARKSLVNQLNGEFEFLLSTVDLRRLVSEKGYAERVATGTSLVKVFSEAGAEGTVPMEPTATGQQTASPTGESPMSVGDLSGSSPEELYYHRSSDAPYIGVLSAPIPVTVGGWSGNCYVYFARRLDAGLLGDVGDQIGGDLNVFDDRGALVATSQEGLRAGGFISAIINADAYLRVCLLGSDYALATERAGKFGYQVAYLPVTSWSDRSPEDGSDRAPRAALSVPLVFRPESYSMEVQKASSMVLGIFALLFVATIGLGLVLARGIFEPLRALLEGTRRIGRGDLDVRLPLRRTDEIGTVLDAFNEMTERLSASQSALEERRRYLETILANIGAGVISTDADDRVRTVNNAAERILGIDAAAAMGRTAGELVGSGFPPEMFRLLSEGKAADEPFIASEVELRRDGRRATVKYMRTRLDVGGRYFGTVLVFEDVTELIQTKKLSAWLEMARQIAHEIKNPLTPIRISTQFMQRAYEQKSEKFDEIFRESAKTIIQQVDVLKRIAGEFSSYGRMQHLEVGPRPLGTLLREVVTPYLRNASGVDVQMELGEANVPVMVDAEAFRKICSNLIENALEAMPEGGSLNVSWREETFDGGPCVRISFRDSGPGFSAEATEKLFEPYFSTKTTGTGLGLAICRSLSRGMGGDIEVQNVPAGGADASVLLKLASRG